MQIVDSWNWGSKTAQVHKQKVQQTLPLSCFSHIERLKSVYNSCLFLGPFSASTTAKNVQVKRKGCYLQKWF